MKPGFLIHRLPPRRLEARTGGTTLLECIACFAAITIVINVGMSTFVSASRLSSYGVIGLDRVTMTDDVREGFCGALREAQAVVAGVGAYHTSENVVVLEMPLSPGQAGGHRYAVLGCVLSKDRLSRMEVAEENGAFTVTRCSNYALPVASVHFGYDSADPLRARRITVRANALNTHQGKAPIPYQFSASLRSWTKGESV